MSHAAIDIIFDIGMDMAIISASDYFSPVLVLYFKKPKVQQK